jgi:hypothetical protein
VFVAANHPMLSMLFGNDEEKAEFKKVAICFGVAGIALLIIASFVR